MELSLEPCGSSRLPPQVPAAAPPHTHTQLGNWLISSSISFIICKIEMMVAIGATS